VPEPQQPASGPGSAAEDAAEAWRALRDGIGAAASASGHQGETQCVELCPICRTADLLRASGPPELREQITEFQREALTTLRTLLDHYIERLDRTPPAPTAVEEIPID
jgi:hypothetical protein